MSHVTDIILLTAIDDGWTEESDNPNADLLSAWLVKNYGPANALKPLHQMATGGKAMQSNVFGVAVDFCEIPRLINKFNSIRWANPERVQLLVKDEYWESFRVYNWWGS